MENEIIKQKLFLSEFSYFDGDHLITFNIVDINTDKKEITVAISNHGKISHCSFDIKSDAEGLFFEYGVMLEKIAVNDFEQVED